MVDGFVRVDVRRLSAAFDGEEKAVVNLSRKSVATTRSRLCCFKDFDGRDGRRLQFLISCPGISVTRKAKSVPPLISHKTSIYGVFWVWGGLRGVVTL